MDDNSPQAELARQILRPFRDVQNGGDQQYDDQAWWIDDLIDRIERAITPYLASPADSDREPNGSR
jgi:hypothetical protein